MGLVRRINAVGRTLRTQGLGGTARGLQSRVRPGRGGASLSEVNRGGAGIVNFVDVGSVGGLPQEWRRHAAKIRFLLNFEPRDQPLVTENVVTMNTALWSENCTREFYIYKGSEGRGSSLFRQNVEYVRGNWEELKRRGPAEMAGTWFDRAELARTEQLACRALDDVIEQRMPSVPFHFVKIDAQGAEYEILKGAERLLSGSCVGLCLELFVIPMYEGIRLLPEVEEYLSGRGFRLVRKEPAQGTFDCAHDCLFLKTGAEGEAVKTIREVYDL